jgi:hypothetical protein
MKRTIIIVAILATIAGILALWFTDHQASAISTLITSVILALLIRFYSSGIKDNRFFFRLKEGTVVSVATGSDGPVSHYVVAPKTWDRIWQELQKAHTYFSSKIPEIRDPALGKIQEIESFINEHVKMASGFLSRFNYYTLSWWNRAITLKAIDSQATGTTHFPFIRSITREFDDVEISGSGGAGTVAIRVKFQIASFLFLHFSRIFNEPEPSNAQIDEQVRSALSLYLVGSDSETLEARRFLEENEARAMLHLLKFGMLGFTLSIPDYDLKKNPALAQSLEDQAVAAEKQRTAQTEAETLRIKAEGNANATRIEAAAKAAALREQAKALEGVHPDVARILFSPEDARLPVGASTYAGTGEVWIDGGGKNDKSKDNSKPKKEEKPK